MIPTHGVSMSINDPQWGRGGSGNNGGGNGQRRPDDDGPPDLEELWQQINSRISGMFGNKGRGPTGGGMGSGGMPDFNMKRFLRTAGIVFAVLVTIWIISGFYIVDATQRGIVQRFGRYSETTLPGLHWRFPSPIESHTLVNFSGVRTLEIGYRGSEQNIVPKESLMLTDDENIINAKFAVQYILKNAVDFTFQNRYDNNDSNTAVMQAAETAIREVVGRSKMDYVLYEGREQIAAEVSALVQEILDRYRTGILVSKVTMQNAQPPDEVQAAFDDAVKAGQDKERQKSEGQAYANNVVPSARGLASRLLQEAEGYRQRLIANAEGDASRFSQLHTEYEKAPEVTRQRLYLETMQHVYGNVSKVIIDSKASGNLLYLPLDQLMKAAVSSVATPQSHGSATKESTSGRLQTTSPPQTTQQPDRNNSVLSRILTRDRENR